MTTPGLYILNQRGQDPLSFWFEDENRKVAFTIEQVVSDANPIVKLTRRDDWAQLHPDIMGPRNAYFYFGPAGSPGQLAYGNGERVGMTNFLRRKKENSNSRYFTAQSGRELKWKIVSGQRMELCDTRSIIAIWEKGQAGFGPDAQITLTHLGMTIVTEILTTLTLNLVARRLDW